MTRFNPTLVRLRLGPGWRRGWAGNEFQSHAGSIEALVQVAVQASCEMFQSHAGSIEAPPTQKGGVQWHAFQSHAGSIEAGNP